jgi:prepilin peptidase CpaA
MFGKIETFHAVIFYLSITTVVTDLLWGKIYNWATLPTICAGIAFGAMTSGWSGAGWALFGVVIGFALYVWMYMLRFLGAGDVKLLMAFGAWGGPHFAEEVAILSVLVGGCLGIVTMIFTGRFLGFCRRIYHSLISVFLHELEFVPPKIDKTLKMPFGIPMSIAAVWVAFWHPLEKWGMSWWP